MRPDLTLSTTQPGDPDRRQPSSDAVAALSLGERVLLSLGIQAVCLVVHAAELLTREGTRRGRT
jgi:hypothetical protein